MKKRWSKKKIILLVAVLLIVITAAFCLLAGLVWRNYKDSIIGQQKQQMLLTAESVSRTLEISIQRSAADLERFCMLAEADGADRKANEAVLRSYVDEYDNFVTGFMLEDWEGRLLTQIHGILPAQTFGETEVGDGVFLVQVKGEDGKMYFLLRKKTESGNILSLVIDLENYYQSLLSDFRLGDKGYIMVKNSDGIVLMHPVREQLGYNVVEDRKRLYHVEDLSSLETMLESQYAGETGVQEYVSYWWQDESLPKVKKISAYTPAHIGEDFLIISAVTDYNDISVPVERGFRGIIMVITLLFAAIAAVVGACGRLILQRQKDTEEIAYLKDLNELLQKMKRSEETIAHQQRLQIMGTMTGGIAHEFNNLLTPIMGHADLLMLELPEDSEEYDSAAEIYDAAEKAKEIIQQLSALSRRNMETAFRELSLKNVLERSIKMARSVCPAQVKLREDIREDAVILGNKTQISQVLLNICVNAVQAIGEKEGVISVTGYTVDSAELKRLCRLEEAPRAWKRFYCVDVADNGPGMAKEVLEQIFDPFFTTKKNGKGTGLGLALAEQIVSSHKGYILAESEPGKGTVFHIYFPVLEESVETGLRSLGESREEKKRILLAHSNAKVLQLLEKNFLKLRFEVCCCADFKEARAALAEQKFDIMAAEAVISGTSAVEFFMSVKGLHADMVRIVIVDRIRKEILEAKQREIIDGYAEAPVSVPSILEAAKRERS